MNEQAELARLAESGSAESRWRLWGPYLAARQWGTVQLPCHRLEVSLDLDGEAGLTRTGESQRDEDKDAEPPGAP